MHPLLERNMGMMLKVRLMVPSPFRSNYPSGFTSKSDRNAILSVIMKRLLDHQTSNTSA